MIMLYLDSREIKTLFIQYSFAKMLTEVVFSPPAVSAVSECWLIVSHGFVVPDFVTNLATLLQFSNSRVSI